MKRLAVRVGAVLVLIASVLGLSPGVSNAANYRSVDIYVHNSGGYNGEAYVFEGQYPNGGVRADSSKNYDQYIAIGETAYIRMYYNDDLGLTVLGRASLGKTRWVTFGSGAASKICFNFRGSTIAGFGFDIVNC